MYLNIYFLEYPCRKLWLTTREINPGVVFTLHRSFTNNRVVYQMECNECQEHFLYSMSFENKTLNGAWLVMENVITLFILDKEIIIQTTDVYK